MSVVGLAGRMILALVFASAAVGKARRPARFETTLLGLGAPAGAVRYLAWAVVLGEALVALLLLLGVNLAAAEVGTAVLLTAFALAAVIAMRRAERVPCNCFGGDDAPLGWSTLARTALFVLPLATIVVAGTAGPGAWPAQPESVVVAMGLAAGGLMLGRWLLTLPQIAKATRERRRAEVRAAQAAAAPPAVRVMKRSRRPA